ncbi:MAG TPA: XRE family transcriptional regulator [Caldithrix abyssi]|uniref:XRE family transcriptional regulator n=1 Tax=Caldithrix abyssi TaxID=187145 RepID=A0A7V5PNE6_CALAY|nr:XRE family transcriptional regulator [Caldithrix abyssi]
MKTFEDLLQIKYGKPGTKKRDEFDAKSKAFMIGELLKETRKKSKISQEELAQKIGTKKSYISKIENGKSDIQVSTLFRLFEEGLGKKLNLVIE